MRHRKVRQLVSGAVASRVEVAINSGFIVIIMVVKSELGTSTSTSCIDVGCTIVAAHHAAVGSFAKHLLGRMMNDSRS